MEKDWELYDENNSEHNNTDIYEVMEWSNENDSDGRHPNSTDVGTIDDDAQRRDFTCNSLYFRLSDEVLLDPTGMGLTDLLDRKLRFVGNPNDRLQEDGLRMMRFYRFLDKGFEPDSKSLRAVRENWNDMFSKLTPDRARVELEKIIGL
jgi:poly(A) polymerase